MAMEPGMKAGRRRILAACAAAFALAAAAPVRAQNYNPRQAAWLKNEIRQAQTRYVEQAAAISGVPAARIRRWVPTDGRDVAPKLAVLPALERERGKPLSEEERRKLVAAEQERFDAIERAKKVAATR
ncbi:MAG: hypothetical protein COW56_03075 [Rhodocyclales bacterium CG17_big_fil_post_rev_8_21_14_2_50_68_7]|nr:MAG: hypothetical protein COW56_03075 [Rhodocyclales bacterium CG17_big_fil_post_rev_8_21_14_2_50_68_7]PIX76210.1 MAG: hypothetical protein COZ38_01480 [Rhodocyclales bacterium CG_4_10_14_3_um_filter_68_10]